MTLITRRAALESAGLIGLGSLVLGFPVARKAYARRRLEQQLIDEATPVLLQQAVEELTSLPQRACEEIRRFFHVRCLNVASFVSTICGDDFRSKLRACGDDDSRHELLHAQFSRQVLTSVEVNNRVETIAGEIGAELDVHWNEVCKELDARWQLSVHKQNPDARLAALSSETQQLIAEKILAARQQAHDAGRYPALSETTAEIGKSALLLLPMIVIKPNLGWPVFLANSLRHAFSYILGLLRRRSKDYQTSISERLALLGNRVGADFETEIRHRIADLHHWREQALQIAAHRRACLAIPSLI